MVVLQAAVRAKNQGSNLEPPSERPKFSGKYANWLQMQFALRCGFNSNWDYLDEFFRTGGTLHAGEAKRDTRYPVTRNNRRTLRLTSLPGNPPPDEPALYGVF